MIVPIIISAGRSFSISNVCLERFRKISAGKANQGLSDILGRAGLETGIADAWILQATQPLAIAGVPTPGGADKGPGAEQERLLAKAKLQAMEDSIRKELGSLIKLIPDEFQEREVKNLAVLVLFNMPGHEESLWQTFTKLGIKPYAITGIFERLKIKYGMAEPKPRLRICLAN